MDEEGRMSCATVDVARYADGREPPARATVARRASSGS
jgi:hypothetical protein